MKIALRTLKNEKFTLEVDAGSTVRELTTHYRNTLTE